MPRGYGRSISATQALLCTRCDNFLWQRTDHAACPRCGGAVAPYPARTPLPEEPLAPRAAPLSDEPRSPLPAAPRAPLSASSRAPLPAESRAPLPAEPRAPLRAEPRAPRPAESRAPLPAAPPFASPREPLPDEPRVSLAASSRAPLPAEPRAPSLAEPRAPSAATPSAPMPAARPALAAIRARVAAALGLAALVALIALGLTDRGWLLVGPLHALAIGWAIARLASLVTYVPALVRLARDPRQRVLHGLEHATLARLRRRGVTTRGGTTEADRFRVRIAGEVAEDSVRAATEDAIDDFARGDIADAYSPTCGTSLLVTHVLYALVIAGCTLAALGGVAPLATVLACGFAAGVGVQLAAPPLGLAAQRAFTVATRFARARVTSVSRAEPSARAAYVGFCVEVAVEL